MAGLGNQPLPAPLAPAQRMRAALAPARALTPLLATCARGGSRVWGTGRRNGRIHRSQTPYDGPGKRTSTI